MTSDELINTLRQEIKGLADSLVPEDFDNAVAAAERDTGWTSYGSNFKEKIMLERAKRHIFFMMVTESAQKFKYKQINLQHRFAHYRQLIIDLDESFEKAMEENAAEFAGASAYELFGQKVDAGFATESQTGRDFTYDEDQKVIIRPDATD